MIDTTKLIACMELAKREHRQRDLERLNRLYMQAQALNYLASEVSRLKADYVYKHSVR